VKLSGRGERVYEADVAFSDLAKVPVQLSPSPSPLIHESEDERLGVRPGQPRSQSSSAISDVTSPVKLVWKIRLGRLANNGKSKMAYLPGFMGKKRPPHFVAIR